MPGGLPSGMDAMQQMAERRPRSPARAVPVIAASLLVAACAADHAPRFSGPLVPHGTAPERILGPHPGSGLGPSSDRPPWHTDPPANPERYHVPDDGFLDALALA